VHALELCRALARRGHQVHLAALASGAGAASDLDGVELHPIDRALPVTLLEWTAAGELRELIVKLRPDVVVERFYTFGGAAVNAAHSLDVPAVLEVNSPARDYPGSLRDRLDKLTLVRPVDRWRRRMLSRCAAIYTTSRHLLPPQLQDEATVIVNGVDVERFRPGAGSAGDGPLRCVYVSSFRAWHGAEDLVEAVARCVAAGSALHVTCVGEGPRWQRARDAATRAGVAAQLEFTGRVPHERVPGLLARADVGVAPFAPDQFSALELGWFWSPIKIFEYLAAGLAVVTAGIAELEALLPGGVARFYPPGDIAALAATLRALDGDRDAVRTMGRAARSLAKQRYTWDHQAAAVEELLASVVR
jgi:glycosyltransferase involved in cell wall biosynthesis